MSAERRQRLGDVEGWLWDPFTTDWEEGFRQLTAYVQAKGHAKVPQSYGTAEGYRLGQWVSLQRTNKDSMSADRRQRLGDVEGWVWDKLAAAWEKGFKALTAYVQAEGHARVPTSCTAEGYPLGQWVSNQRMNKDSMSADRRQRLGDVEGWVWKAV